MRKGSTTMDYQARAMVICCNMACCCHVRFACAPFYTLSVNDMTNSMAGTDQREAQASRFYFGYFPSDCRQKEKAALF